MILTQDHTLAGSHKGTVRVEAGKFTLAGKINGTLVIHNGVEARIEGVQQGTISVARGATVTVMGAIEGTTSISPGGTVIVEAGGKLAGTLSNEGLVIVRGVFGGIQTGQGKLKLEGRGYVKQPVTDENGVSYYQW